MHYYTIEKINKFHQHVLQELFDFFRIKNTDQKTYCKKLNDINNTYNVITKKIMI